MDEGKLHDWSVNGSLSRIDWESQGSQEQVSGHTLVYARLDIGWINPETLRSLMHI